MRVLLVFFFFSSRRRHTRSLRDWSSDVCSSDLGIVQNPLRHAIGTEIGRREGIAIDRQREDPRHALAIEHQGATWQSRQASGADVREIRVEEGLYPRIGWAELAAEQMIPLLVIAEQRTGDFQHVGARRAAAGGLSESRQFEIDETVEFLVSRCRHGISTPS